MLLRERGKPRIHNELNKKEDEGSGERVKTGEESAMKGKNKGEEEKKKKRRG